MTIQEYRQFLNDGNKVECYGMSFRALDSDVVRILTEDCAYDIKLPSFKSLDTNLYLSDEMLSKEITKILVKKHETDKHCVVFQLDTRETKIKEEYNTIQAKMKLK